MAETSSLASDSNGASNTTTVLALGTTTAAVTLQALGFAVGPAIATQIVSSKGLRMAQFLSITLLVVSAVASLAVFARSRRRTGTIDCASPYRAPCLRIARQPPLAGLLPLPCVEMSGSLSHHADAAAGVGSDVLHRLTDVSPNLRR